MIAPGIPNDLPKSLQDNPRLDRWLAFLPGGTVHLKVGKVEIGQGIATALAQIAAEELDVAPARLAVTAGDTDIAPDEGSTTGSLSIEVSGASVRLVCAEVRALMLAEAAHRLDRPATSLTVADGAILADANPTGLDYWRLAVPLARDATGRVAPKPPAAHTTVGTSLPRLDLPLKLAGGGFLHDMTLPGLRHARMLHPPHAGARFLGADEPAIIRAGATLFVHGNFAAVLADTDQTATRALAAARPRWEGGLFLTPEMGEAAWLAGQPARHHHFGAAGDPPAGPRVSATYARPYISHASPAPSVAIARFEQGRMDVWSHSQSPFPLRGHVATLTGLAPTAIAVHHVQGGGCYGHNGADDAALEAALLALHHPGAPIRVLWTRADEFAHEPAGAAMQVTLSASLDATGLPADWHADIVSAPHVGRMFAANLLPFQALPSPPPPAEPVETAPELGGNASRNGVPLYDVGEVRIDAHIVPRPPLRTSALRGLGAPVNIFAIEGFLDELAERAGMDPLDYRLAILSEPRGRRVLETAAAMANWRARGPAGTGVGLGLGLGQYKNRSAYAAVVVEVAVDTEVRLRRIWCAADAGLVINPDGAINQIEGGIVQAASMALMEQIRITDDGTPGRSWADYPILRFSDLPPIETRLIDAPDERPLGVGECTMGLTAAAIGNAVAHALGTRIRAMPLNRERIAEALLRT